MGVGDWIGDRWDDVTGGVESFGKSVIKRADGFWDAGWELGKAPVNYAWDFVLATKDLVDDNDVGVADWLHQVAWENVKEQTGQTVGALIGPEGIGGNIVEMMPGVVRSGGSQILEGLEWVGREGIREPAAALVTVASLMEADGRGNDFSAWLDFGDYWDEAYEIAQTRSPGQAIVLAFASSEEKSILDEKAVEEWQDTAWFNITSGTLDAAIRIFAGPEELAFGAGMVARAGHRARQFNNYFEEGGKFAKFDDDVSRIADDIGATTDEARGLVSRFDEADRKVSEAREELRTFKSSQDQGLIVDASYGQRLQTNLDEAIQARDLAKFDDPIDLLAGRIKEKYFASHAEGDLISREIALAHLGREGFAGGTQSVKNVMQFFTAVDPKVAAQVVNRIALENPARGFYYGKIWKDWTHPMEVAPSGAAGGNAHEFLTAQKEHDKVMKAIEDGLPPEDLAEISGAVNVIPGFASIDTVIKPTWKKNFQDKVRHSDWYRPGGGKNPIYRTIQLVRDMKPQHHIFAGDANAGDQVARAMKESNLYSAEEIASFRGNWASRSVTSKTQYAEKIQQEIVERVVRKQIPKDKWLKANDGSSAKDYEALIREFVKDYAASSSAARKVLDNARAYDYTDLAQGGLKQGSEIRLIDEGTEILMQTPLTPAQLKQSFFVVDARRLENHIQKIIARRDTLAETVVPALSRFKRSRLAVKHGGRTRQAAFSLSNQAASAVMSAWRPAVLLRPAWALRVVGDEQLRMFAKLQTLSGEGSGLWGLLTSNRRAYVESVFHNYARKSRNNPEGLSVAELAARGNDDLIRAEKQLKKLTRRRAGRSGAVGFVLAGGPGSLLFGGGSFLRNRRAYRAMLRRSKDDALIRSGEQPLVGAEGSSIEGIEVQGPFGTRQDPNIVMREAVSSQRQAGFALDHSRRVNEKSVLGGDWNTALDPRFLNTAQDTRRYTEGWERVVNDQWNTGRAAPIGRIVWSDKTDDEKVNLLYEWMTTTTDGRSFASSVGIDLKKAEFGPNGFGDSVIKLAERQVEVTNRMVNASHPVGQEIRARLARGERVTASDLKNYATPVKPILSFEEFVKSKNLSELTEAQARQRWEKYLEDIRSKISQEEFAARVNPPPPAQLSDFVGAVHGQEKTLIGLGEEGKDLVKRTVDGAYRRIAGLTTDELSRNPYFSTIYRRSMERRIKAATSKQKGATYELSEDALRIMEDAARKEALQEVRWLMYDLAESSRFSDMVRMIMPFYNAWQEVITRWAGLAYQNPVFAARMKDALTANPDVDLGTLGAYETVQDADGNSFFQVRLPDFATGLIRKGLMRDAADDAGIIRFRTSSLNMITQGLPGFGPIAQFPASLLVQQAPELEDAMSFMLPYGPVELTDALPAYVKRLISATLQDDRSYQNMAVQIMVTKLADMANGEIDIIDFEDNATRAQFLKEIQDAAQGAMYVRAIGTAVSPASFNLHSPYQPYIDVYRRLKEEDSANADENFLNYLLDEGNEGFFALSMRQTKNMEGIPPTVWAENQREMFEDLVVKHPELGGLIIGVEGGGAAKFSSSVYNRQLGEETFPGSGVMRRERLSLDDMLTDTRVRAGWEAYGNLMDGIYGAMRVEGLPNLRVSEAAGLKAVRDRRLALIAEEFPLWYDEFSNPDTTKWADRIEGMREIVRIYEDPNDTRFDGREDIKQLGVYLEVRDAFASKLAERKAGGGSGQLDARSNQDLAEMWDTWRLDWADNPASGDLFFRWFEFDSIKQDTWAR